MTSSRRVLDPDRDLAAIKALTHPLRIRLLGLLRVDGPATATELALRTEESSASTSYHLRVLAKHAFIVEAEGRDGRERRWAAVHAVTSFSNEALEAVPGGGELLGLMRRRQIEHLASSLDAYENAAADGRLGPEWRETAGINDVLPSLTPDSLVELNRTVENKLEELGERDAHDPRAARVVVLTALLPLVPPPTPDAPEHGAQASPAPGPGAVERP